MQQVADWLEKLGLGQYAQRFAESDITFGILSDLTDLDLKELGVSSLGHRRQLLRAIAELTTREKDSPKPAATAASSAAPRDTAERRQVTVMFSDLVGSTALSARMDPEDLREVISAYQKCVAETVRQCGGFVAKYLGDGVLVYFGYPRGPREAVRVVTFFDELKLLGFVEGKNLSIVPGGFDLRSDHYAEYARTLAKSNPDVIYCVGDGATLAAREATQSIPVVGFFTPNIVAAGVVQAFARPGGNVTGVSFPSELDGKRQELLLEAVPGAQGIAILADPNYTPPAQLQVLEDAARARGLKAVVLTAGKEAEIVPAMDKAKELGATALNVLSTHLFSANRRVIIERAAALHLSAIYEWPEMAKEGGLIAYGPPLLPMWRQAAQLVAKLFHSAKPQDLPVELPTKYDLIVNLKTAKALGLTIPESFLARADEVIE